MNEKNEKKLVKIVILAASAFIFVLVQFIVEGFIVAVNNFAKDGYLLVALLQIAIFTTPVFLMFYQARKIEEEMVKGGRNKYLEIIFYYVLPVVFYLILRKDFIVEGPISAVAVIVISTLVRWGMEWLFKKIYKKEK